MSDLIPGNTTPIVWICLPTYNEAENLRPMVESLLAVCDSSGMDGHVLVIDDDSPDGTGTIADDLAAVNLQGDDFHPEWNYTITPST